MKKEIFTDKYYTHFDVKKHHRDYEQRVENINWVGKHGFYPFIHFQMGMDKYTNDSNGNKYIKHKDREIYYAGHIDRFIYQYYGNRLNDKYNIYAKQNGINKVSTAYRNSTRGKCNIDFAKEVFEFIVNSNSAYILVGDFSKFFDKLDHKYLKEQLKRINDNQSLDAADYAIYKNLIHFSYIEADDIETEKEMYRRDMRDLDKYFDTKEFHDFKSKHLKKHTENYGIPQGSSISAVYANVYMIEFDQKINDYVTSVGGMYRRYCDDIVIVVPMNKNDKQEKKYESVSKIIFEIKDTVPNLDLNPDKTEQFFFEDSNIEKLFGDSNLINYLGFTFDGKKVRIRDKSLFKFYCRAYKKIRKVKELSDEKSFIAGKKAIYRSYTHLGNSRYSKGHGNFLTYAYKAHAVFTFSDDRHESMTTNILMNVFIPNICMIFLFVGLTSLKWTNISLLLMVYCLSYYAYRFLLICLILGRMDLFNVKYEVPIAVLGILLGGLLNIFFLQSTDTLFISVSELREELWFAIILVVYGIIKNVLDMKVKQDDVLTEKQLGTYIVNKFDLFYKKYASALNIDSSNTYICIAIFSIMIFEDFNRGQIVRGFERIKVKTGHEATLGIMQVKSDKVISNWESVKQAYKLIIQYSKDYLGRELSEGEVEQIAQKYNCGEKYSESIAYIYSRLLEYINTKEMYIKEFCMEASDEVTEFVQYNCASIGEMCQRIQDNCEINLIRIEGDILEGVEESEKVCVNRTGDGWELVLRDLNNVEINGHGSHLYSHFSSTNVIVLEDCYNVNINGFKFGHKVDLDDCDGDVITMRDCYGIILEKVEIYGCGVYGICTNDSEYSCIESEIHHCKNGAIWSEESEVTISNTKIHDCKKCSSDLIYVSDTLLLENVEIYNNYTDLALVNTNRNPFEFHKVRVYNNDYRKKSFFIDDLSKVEFGKNRHLGWN